MSPPAVTVLAVVVLLLGLTLGWLWRGALCRRRHPTGAFEPAGLGTFFDEEPGVTPGEYAGSAVPLAGGAAPHPAYTVKAKKGSRIYHPPGASSYARTTADVWFRSAEDAEAAGFRAPRTGRQGAA